jgi:dTDP-4-dehydrorhamnose reductase
MNTCRVLITGGTGQLGQALQRTAPAAYEVYGPGRAELDITCAEQVAPCVQSYRPHAIINAAAYTDVDGAEQETEKAHAVNAQGPATLAKAAWEVDARFIHLSTDFVFDGTKGRPYQPTDAPNPINVYGKSKWAGEKGVLEVMSDALIVRTAWLYGGQRDDFVNTMLQLMRTQPTVDVVHDQVGTPTEVTTLAEVLWKGLDHNLTGVHHWTDAGVASWYDFAVAIAEEAEALGLIDPVHVEPIGSQDYPRPAARPSYSVLNTRSTRDALALRPEHWRHSLRRLLDRIAEQAITEIDQRI